DVARSNDSQRVDAAPVGARDTELEAIDRCGLAAPGQPAELLHQQARDGIEPLLFRQPGAEVLVEFFYSSHTPHGELPLALPAYFVPAPNTKPTASPPDALLDAIPDGHQPRPPAVLIDHDGHVIAVAAEFLQQHVEPLGLRHEHRRTHVFADIEAL